MSSRTRGRLGLRRAALMAAALASACVAAPSAQAATATFFNRAPIYVDAQPDAVPIQVFGVPGRVSRVTVALNKIIHPALDDLDVALVSPDGRHTLLMSDACAGAATGWSLAFSPSAPAELGPTAAGCGGYFYRPTNFGPEIDPLPNLPGDHLADLDRPFMGAAPNGTWHLVIVDDHPNLGSGDIRLGWSLTVETEPAGVVLGDDPTGIASDYPLRHQVVGRPGVISDVDVALPPMYYSTPDQLSLLLVSPSGERVPLLQAHCGFGAVRDLRLTFDDESPDHAPSVDPCLSKAYRPSGREVPRPLPAPAPQGVYEPTLGAFDGGEPNGEWRLYAADGDTSERNGFFTSAQFGLTVTTRPPAEVAVPAALRLSEGDQADLLIERPAEGVEVGRGEVTVNVTPQSASADDFRFAPRRVQFARGERRRALPVEALRDAVREGEETFLVTLSDPAGDVALGTARMTTVTIAAYPAPLEDRAVAGGVAVGGGAATAGGGGLAGASGGAVVSVPDRSAPRLTRIGLAPRTLLRSPGARVRRAVLYISASEPATATVRVQRRTSKGWRTAGTVRARLVKGANRVAIPVRLAGRLLAAGSYRPLVTATDASGNRRSVRGPSFRVLR